MLLRSRLHCNSFLPTLPKTIRDRFYGIPIPKLRLIRSKTILPAQHYFLTLLTTLKSALSPTHLVSVWVQRWNSGLTTPGGRWRSFRENFQPRNAFTVLRMESWPQFIRLSAIYKAIRHFLYFLEGQDFSIITDHKPLIYMFSQRIEKISQRQQRQIAFISQFTTIIAYQPGGDSLVANSLSRVESIRVPTEFGLSELAQAQIGDADLQNLITDPNCSLTIRKIQWGPEHTSIYCDLTGETLRAIIPPSLRELIFHLFHKPAHPSAKDTDRVIRKRYLWPSMRRDISDWCKACPECQQSKISRHNRLLPGQITAPDGRFRHVHIDIIGPLPVGNVYKNCLTITDRFSRWPEAVPLTNIEVLTVCRAFVDNWMSRYGSPETR